MNNHARINRIKYIDEKIHAMQCAGYDLSEADIAFIWRSASGEADADEITVWTTSMASKLGSAALDPVRLQEMESAAALIVFGMQVFDRRLRLLAKNVDFAQGG